MNTEAKKFSFYIDGIRCLGCVGQIEKAIRPIAGVDHAIVNFENKTVAGELRDEAAIAVMKSAVAKLGFRLIPADSPTAQIMATDSSRKALKELAVAGACAGNIMTFAIPIYAGLGGELRTAFEWISFFLFIPVILYSSRSFYVGALSAMKTRRLNIDFSIVIALTLTSVFSVVGLVSGSGQIYFDSTSNFVFLILVTRFLMERSRQKLLVPIKLQELLSDTLISIIRDNQIQKISAQQIVRGDRLLLVTGQVLPVDAINCSDSSVFDSSFVDGESLPRVYANGASLASGYRAVNNDTVVEALTDTKNSRLAKFIESLNRTSINSSAAVTQSDRVAATAISLIVIIAAGVMGSGYWFGWADMISRGTALLVIACPCALAFAAPVTIGAFLRKGIKNKIFIRDAKALELLSETKNVFLDKTGTLTEGQLELVSATLNPLPSKIKNLILALESISDHPVAFAFRRAWASEWDLPLISYPREMLGMGVEGYVAGVLFEIKIVNTLDDMPDLVVGLFADGKPVCEFILRDRLRSETRTCVDGLRRRGMEVYILSGDRYERVKSVGTQLGFDEKNLFFQHSPEQKSLAVKKLKHTLMVGDGINDGLALKSADVGVAVRGSFSVALSSASVFMGRPGLNPLIDLFKIADQCRNTLRRNMTIAVAYNLIGGALAITGYVNPLFAAIAMPVSSLIILVSTHIGVRCRF